MSKGIIVCFIMGCNGLKKIKGKIFKRLFKPGSICLLKIKDKMSLNSFVELGAENFVLFWFLYDMLSWNFREFSERFLPIIISIFFIIICYIVYFF
jgi:hypothetical protein